MSEVNSVMVPERDPVLLERRPTTKESWICLYNLILNSTITQFSLFHLIIQALRKRLNNILLVHLWKMGYCVADPSVMPSSKAVFFKQEVINMLIQSLPIGM